MLQSSLSPTRQGLKHGLETLVAYPSQVFSLALSSLPTPQPNLFQLPGCTH